MTESTALFDARVAAVEFAIAIAGGAEPPELMGVPLAVPLREQLEVERQLLSDAPPDERSDHYGEVTMLAWLQHRTAGEIADAAAKDPVHQANSPHGSPPPAVDLVVATTIAAMRPGPRTSVPDLRAAVGDSSVNSLVAIARAARLADPIDLRAYLWRDVGVLLPVRLETIVSQDSSTDPWIMRLRIIPDEPSVLRHDPEPTDTEIALVTAMWQQLYDSLPPAVQQTRYLKWFDQDQLISAPWETLCSRFGGPRAAWLVGSFPPNRIVAGQIHIDAGAAHPTPPNRVSGLPPTIEVWCDFGGGAERVHVIDIPQSDLPFDVVGADLVVDEEGDPTVVEPTDRWWVSFEAAMEVGLGATFELPNGHSPDDIAALYVVGIGDASPEDHFAELVNAGEMSRVPLGAPTNTVDGAHAADLGADPQTWRAIARRRLHDDVSDPWVSLPLTGDFFRLGPIPGRGSFDGDAGLDRLLVQSAWPVLWGHHFRDLWAFGPDADRLGIWAVTNLSPHGPYPPIRISEQPYGLLPTSVMGRWSVDDEAGAYCEPRMAEVLSRIRKVAATAATGGSGADSPTAAGASPDRLMELIGVDAVSHDYVYRPFFSAELWQQLYLNARVESGAFEEKVADMVALAKDLYAQDPARTYLGVGEATTLELPLVVPTRWPHWYTEDMPVGEAMQQVLTEIATTSGLDLPGIWGGEGKERGMMPDSLLIRLLWQAKLTAEANAVRDFLTLTDPMLDHPYVELDATELGTYAHQYDETLGYSGPAYDLARTVIDGIAQLGDIVTLPGALEQLEFALRATLDTATHRIDPWFTGMVARRLRGLSESPTARHRLGLYGWVDGPLLGSPGPTDSGVLHTPSHEQALTAIILRDSDVPMRLESNRIRLADEIADEVRIGAHPFEAIGRQVERVIAGHDDVETVRKRFPLRLDRPDAARVCHGIEALDTLLGPTGGTVVDMDVDGRRDGLKEIRAALDTYGDLLVAEGVHQVVSGRPDIAGNVMDVAAGFATPPKLDILRTPLTAEALRTSVISILPAAPAGGGDGPAFIADPAVAAAIEAQAGAADEWVWVGAVVDGAPAPRATLADLKLTPADAAALAPDLLGDLAACVLGGPPDPVASTALRRHRRATDVLDSLGAPAFVADVVSDAASLDPAEIAALDGGIADDLLVRYNVLRDAAATVAGDLSSASGGGDAAACAEALSSALRWGVVPHVEGARRPAVLSAMLGVAPPADLTPASVVELRDLAGKAATALTVRVDAAPELPAKAPDAHEIPRADETIARAIVELASPTGRVGVLASMKLGDLLRVTGIDPTEDNDLDEDWLSVCAAVRPHLARVEALQLEAMVPSAFPPLLTWSNSREDHWQREALADFVTERNRRADPSGSVPRFVAAHSTDRLDGDPEAQVSVGLVDSWVESVPRPVQTTTGAFGFNAPTSRAPQAILIAVPPELSDFGAPLDEELLVEIVADTRLSARARAAGPHQFGGLQAAVGTAMFAAASPTGLRLDTDTSYP